MSTTPRLVRWNTPNADGTGGFGRQPFGSASTFGAPRIVDLLGRISFGHARFGTSPFGSPQPPTGD